MKIIALTALLLVSACATVTSESTQDIHVSTDPAGASCELSNGFGTVHLAQTPGTVKVHRSFTPLAISCSHPQSMPMTTTLEPHTRGRAYGNLLLLGLPAAVDAGTGYGYEYAPDDVLLSK